MPGRRSSDQGNKPLTTKDTKEHKGEEGRGRPRTEPAATRAEEFCGQTIISNEVERSDKNKEMTHRFPCQDAFSSNRWVNLLYFSCQVLQLLTLEAASRKRLSLF